MEINYYSEPNAQGYDESWQACQFTSETDLTPFRSYDLVTINGQPYLRQHHVTYLTGRETCRAHHFAKHLAIQVLSKQPSTPSSASSPSGCKVLWIDTLNSPYVSAPIYRELVQHATRKSDLHYICLDILGEQRDNHWWLCRSIESLLKQLKPQLLVIDDMDHFMPYCGLRVACEFNRIIRDGINHTDASFLFIGYNHAGKKACTAGDLGKRLFNSSNDIFSVSTVREVTTVRHVSGYDLRVFPGDSQFHFTIGPDNLPHETVKPGTKPATGIDDDTLRDIVEGILQEEKQESQAGQGSQAGQERQGTAATLTPSDLISKVKARHAQLKRDTRDTAILDQIHRLHLLQDGIQPVNSVQSVPSVSSVCGDAIATEHSGSTKRTPEGRDSGTSHAMSPATTRQGDKQQGMASAPSEAVACAAAQQRPPQDQEINTSLTLPPHHQHPATCPVGGGSAAVLPQV